MAKPAVTTTQNAAFIARPTFDSSLEENVSDDFYIDDEFAADDEELLPSFKTVVLDDARASVKWSKPRLEPTTSESVFKKIGPKSNNEQKLVSGIKYSQFLGPDETLPNPTPGVGTGVDRFYDFQTCKWVEVDNFAFAGEVNHFLDQSDLAVGNDTAGQEQQQKLPAKKSSFVPKLPEVTSQSEELSLTSSANDDESSLAILDPKYFARMDSSDLFSQTSMEGVVNNCSPIKRSQISHQETADSIQSLTSAKKSLVKQLSMCVLEEGGDRFRPQGTSSPLLTALDEISQPSSIECQDDDKMLVPPINFCEDLISQNQIFKVPPINFCETEISQNQISKMQPANFCENEKVLIEFEGSEEPTNFKPKILSPCDKSFSTENKYRRKSSDNFRRKSQEEMQQNKTKSMRRLSNDLGCTVLPSRSGMSTPKTSDVSYDNDDQEQQQQQQQQQQPQHKQQSQPQEQKTKIPRFIRNSNRSHSSGSSPIERKLKHQVEQSSTGSINSTALHQDRVAKKLGQNKSHSVANLSKISVRDYHNSGAFHGEAKFSKSSAKKSLSFDCLQRAKSFSNDLGPQHRQPLKTTAHLPINKYDHVQSKVRKYIDGYSNSGPSSVKRAENFPAIIDDRSFLLSPGRKSLSMSNLSASTHTTSRRPSQSNLVRMKTFLSSRQLDGVQITISGAKLSQSRESLHSNEVMLDTSRISRLLDNMSDDELQEKGGNLKEYDDSNSHDVCVFPISKSNLDPNPNEEDIVMDVEDLLQLALEERKGKQEAKLVLCQLQENYDTLQRKYAQAENIIDKLRFGSADVGGVFEAGDSAFVDPNTEMMSSRIGSTYQAASSLNSLFTQENNRVSQQVNSSHVPNPHKFNVTVRRQNSNVEKLKEIHEQLFGLELLSSTPCSLTLTEKKKIIDHLRLSFDQIKTNSNMNSCDTLLKDEDFLRLLAEVGRKLLVLEAKEKSSCEDALDFEIAPPVKEIEKEKSGLLSHMGPIEKVEKWRETQQLSIEDGVKKNGTSTVAPPTIVGVNSIIPSCYGSCPTSPTTGSGSREALDQTDRQQRKSFDFDSGCPGSDRSTRNPLRKSPPAIHPLSAAPLSGHSDRYRLFNVDEKEEKSSNKSPVTTDRSRKSGAVILQNAHRSDLRLQHESATDLSSDEHQVATSVIKQRPKEVSSASQQRPKDIRLLPTPPSVTGSSQNVTPRGANAILASQIDQEILELRNLYEHHREEMMSLAKSSSTPIKKAPFQNADTQTPTKSPTKHQRLFASRQPLCQPFESESDFDVSMQEERRIEFQQRRLRQMQKKKCQNRSETQFESHNRSESRFESQNGNKSRYEKPSNSDIHRSDLRREPLSTPNFAIGSPTSPVAVAPITKAPAISSFFPAVPSNNAHIDAFSNKINAFSNNVAAFSIDSQSEDATDGRRIAVVGGDDVFIPRLDLDELVSEGSENFGGPRQRDPRSFDFNQSLDQDQVEEEHYNGTRQKGISSRRSSSSNQSQTRRRVVSLANQGCQVNENESLFPLRQLYVQQQQQTQQQQQQQQQHHQYQQNQEFENIRRSISASHLLIGNDVTAQPHFRSSKIGNFSSSQNLFTQTGNEFLTGNGHCCTSATGKGQFCPSPNLLSGNELSSNRPIIIVQCCCGGHSSSRSCQSEASGAVPSEGRRSQLHPDQVMAKKTKSSRSSKKAKQQDELRKLLISLSEANALALNLKQRSAEMLDMIGQDMRTLHTSKPV